MLSVYPITVNNFSSLFNCSPVSRASDLMMARHKAIYFSWLGPELFCPLLGPSGFNCWFSFAPEFQWVARHPRDLQVSVAIINYDILNPRFLPKS